MKGYIMTKFTPAPWMAKAGLSKWNVTTSYGERTYNICSVNTDRIEQEANARLIAAAPEMYEALKRCYELFNMDDVDTAISMQVGMALSKAEGEI